MQPERDDQPTFFDRAMRRRGAANKVPETRTREVDFSEAKPCVAATYGGGGQAACRVGVLLRILILQHLHGLNDPQVEAQIKDRLSFHKFVQLAPSETVPDETTICRFRQRQIEGNLPERLLQQPVGGARLHCQTHHARHATLVVSRPHVPRIHDVSSGHSRIPPYSHGKNQCKYLRKGRLHAHPLRAITGGHER
jgi:hypothetical protein